MRETTNNKANDMAAINRRKQKKAAQRHGDSVSEQIFSDVANKNTFGTPEAKSIPNQEIRDKRRLEPRVADGVTSPKDH